MPSAPTYDTIIAQILARTRGERAHQGRQFEALVKYYLLNDPIQRAQYKAVHHYADWQRQRGENQQDIGIDLIAENQDGGLTAIQAKFYAPGTPISRKDIDTFLAASSKKRYTNRLFIATTDKWSAHAEAALRDQSPPCHRLSAHDMRASPIDWAPHTNPKAQPRQKKHAPRPHQQKAIADTLAGLNTADRGKLIMACGTGKTYTALQIAEKIAPAGGHILFLVPSLSLLSQALHEWSAHQTRPLRSFVVCSDAKVGQEKKSDDSEDISMHDLALPATTNPEVLAHRLSQPFEKGTERLNVVYATYHSIATIAAAQKQHSAPAFDLIICDEAHRTVGSQKITEKGEKETSYYTKVHDSAYIKATKRLYMTATPRIYTEASKQKAKEHQVDYYSMDDQATYGKELHRLGFAQAVDQQLLSDYRVLVLCVNEKETAAAMAQQTETGELTLHEKAKITGCLNGLARKIINPAAPDAPAAQTPMRRAVAFATTIKKSKLFADAFNETSVEYTTDDGAPRPGQQTPAVNCIADHIDGGMNAMRRAAALQWLRDDPAAENQCHILSNAKCLSEGIDVPALDAVIFMDPRKSQTDVVQSVGRVMRKAPGKQYGYVILPIVIPADKQPEEALNSDPNTYKTVWQVLQALRAHDERFSAYINLIDVQKLQQEKQDTQDQNQNPHGNPDDNGPITIYTPTLFPDFENWRDAILARIVLKCGSRRYWEDWAKDVAHIAAQTITRINAILDKADDQTNKRFQQFLAKLQKNLNPSVTRADAIEMLSQHLITRPVFNALFEGYTFADKNPVSVSMTKMIKLLDKHGLENELQTLSGFYDDVRLRAARAKTAADKQKIMVELYEKFFSTAFKKQAEKLGIVYTPIEIVDFILQSADAALQKHFNRKLTGSNVHILDPFTGTGTFIARLLRPDSPLITAHDLVRKYQSELHANEITLLAYYIAAINIEQIYHHRTSAPYQPFGGIVLTDTFQLGDAGADLYEDFFQENSARAKKQRKAPIQVIIGNPPYSAKQGSGNDDNQNEKYPHLDQRITATYAKDSKATNKNNLYDSYIRAIRWASDRIKDEGIVAFVTNGSFIDGNALAGLRKNLLNDFSDVYCFNLRGNARTQGEQRRKERGNVFGEGTRTPVAITILIKKKSQIGTGALHYHDIGDYLDQEEKLNIIKQHRHYANIDWQTITPNEHNDWINQRNPIFLTYTSMGDKENKRKGSVATSIFNVFSNGVKTNRDAWVYGFSKKELAVRMEQTIAFYNSQVEEYQNSGTKSAQDFVNKDATKISWSRELIKHVEKKNVCSYNPNNIRVMVYRPFCKQYLFLDKMFVDLPAIARRCFPAPDTKNLTICVHGIGASSEFSALMVDTTPDLNLMSAGCQCFPLYHYEGDSTGRLLGRENKKQENITDAALRDYQTKYKDNTITKQDIFYYVYGILHSPEYKQRYAADLTKMLPRIPQVKTKTAFKKYTAAGQALADLHLNYETAPEYPVQETHADLINRDATVIKMKHPGKPGEKDRTTIQYNPHITITGIPLEAYDYQINGKSAIEWIMDRYQQTVHKESQIPNNPNQWSQNPRHILTLLKQVIHTSIETTKIIKTLPPLED